MHGDEKNPAAGNVLRERRGEERTGQQGRNRT
jgi:hypothetical protein